MIDLSNLSHSYRSKNVLKDINLSIERGTTLGIIGPNGAGKTTLLSIMQSLITPDQGEIRFMNEQTKDMRKRWIEIIGVQLQSTSFIDELTVYEQVKFFLGFHEKSTNKDDIEKLLRDFKLMHLKSRFPYQLSGGERQKLALLLAVVHEPKILFLDEPSTGLDPIATHELWDRISELKGGDMTIIMTSHNMKEIEVLCDEVAILFDGSIEKRNKKQGSRFIDDHGKSIDDFDEFYVDSINELNRSRDHE